MSKEKKLGATFAGITSTKLYEVSFEDKKKPSENGLGFSTMICAPDEETARKWFAKAEPDCEIKEVIEREGVLMPIFNLEDPTNMKMDEYQEKAMSTCLPESENVEYMVLNLVGEVGELCEKMLPYAKDPAVRSGMKDAVDAGKKCSQLAKSIRKGEYKVDEPIDVVKIEDEHLIAMDKELGDVLWQTTGTCHVLGTTLGITALMNIQKLAARKEAGTIDGNGDGVTAEDGRK